MTLAELQREIAALPALPAGPSDGPMAETPVASPPLQIVSRQGRVILRLTAAVESLEARSKEMAAQVGALNARTASLEDARREAERRSRQLALEAVHLMDALDWVQAALAARGDDPLAPEVAAARRDCLRRLAAAGVTEIPCDGPADGRLHEAVETTATDEKPRYHIVSVVRRGFQCGPEVLRRAEVVTAA